jgi:hypothetical protein
MDIEDRSDLNNGKPWAETQLFDLANRARLGDPIDEIAGFLANRGDRSATRSVS